MVTKTKHGGTRDGAGRPPLNGERGERFQVHLAPQVEKFLRDLGGGSLSQGITIAATVAHKKSFRPKP